MPKSPLNSMEEVRDRHHIRRRDRCTFSPWSVRAGRGVAPSAGTGEPSPNGLRRPASGARPECG